MQMIHTMLTLMGGLRNPLALADCARGEAKSVPTLCSLAP